MKPLYITQRSLVQVRMRHRSRNSLSNLSNSWRNLLLLLTSFMASALSLMIRRVPILRPVSARNTFPWVILYGPPSIGKSVLIKLGQKLFLRHSHLTACRNVNLVSMKLLTESIRNPALKVRSRVRSVKNPAWSSGNGKSLNLEKDVNLAFDLAERDANLAVKDVSLMVNVD